MEITPITAETEERLIKASKEMISLTGAGLTPDEALEKVATDYSFTPAFIDRVGQLYNTSCTLRQLSDTKGHTKRSIEHALADPAKVAAKLFSQSTEKKAYLDNRVVSAHYEDPMSFGSVEPIVKAAAESTPLPKLSEADFNLLYKRACAKVHGMRRNIDAMRTAVLRREEERDRYLDKAAAYFRRPGCESFAEVEERLRSVHGAVGVKVAEALWHNLGGAQKLCKRAGESDGRPKHMPSQSPYLELNEFIKLSGELVTARKMVKAATESVDHVEASIKARAAELVHGPVEKEAGITTALQFKGVNELVDALTSDDAVARAEQKAKAEAIDPVHEADLRAIKAQAIFQRLLSEDPVIGQYGPAAVAEAYNEISAAAPSITAQPVALRGYLRRFLESSPQPTGRTLDTFETGQLADLEKKLRAGQPDKEQSRE
jgi:hypothetical protein